MGESPGTVDPQTPEPPGRPQGPAPGDPEALRRELRRLGYLTNPLERFLVGDLSRPASPLVTNLVVGLKVGVLAGLLVGGLLLVGFLLSHPALASSPRDVLVVTAYVLVLVGAGLSAASIVVGLLMHLAARLTRRAVPVVELIATRGAVVVSGALLLYLALWWRAIRARLGRTGFGRLDVVVVLGALVVAGVLAVAVRGAGRALLLRLEGRLPGARRRSPLWWPATLAAAGAVAFFLVGYVGLYGAAEPAEPVEFSTAYAGARLYLVAVEGLSYQQAGEAFGSESGGGEWPGGPPRLSPLRVPAAMNSATLWTTTATGLAPRLHGVESFETTRVAGLARYVPLRGGGAGLEEALSALLPFFGFARRAPVSSPSLAARPLWEILSQKGLRVAAVNWWATWPATEVRGVVVSDRTFAKLDLLRQEGRQQPPFEGETYPEAAFALAREVWEEVSAEAEGGASAPPSVGFRMDEFHRALLLALLERAGAEGWPRQYEFLAVYLPGLDIAEHELLSDARPLSPGELEAGLQRLRRARRELVGWLARLAREAQRRGADLWVVGVPSRRERTSGAAGFSLFWGPDLASAAAPGELSLYDVAPTVLALMGFPVSGEMPGKARLGLFASPRVPTTVSTLPSYGPRRADLQAPSSVIDREYRERLRSLGYID